ncbi:MAG TPA: hypothetical protein VID04_02050 [Methylomirabilota bacterium]
MRRRHALAAGLVAGLLVLAGTAEAQISFRAATSAANPATISFVGAGALVTSATSGASLTPALPSTQVDDLAIVFVAGRPSDTSEPTTPTGWTKRTASYLAIGGSNDLKIITYYKVLLGGDSNPSFTVPATWSGANGGMSAAIGVWRNVDVTTPFDVADVTGNSGANPWTPPAVTTATANARAVSAVATSDNNALAIGTANGFTARMSGAAYDTTTGGDHSIAVADKLQASVGAVTMLSWNQTNNATDSWVGISFALRPATGALSIAKPAGTVTDDVMIASVAVNPYSITLTPPTGWTLVRRLDNTNANSNALAVYRKVAGASEPGSYTWTVGPGHNGVVGGIQTFVGVDTTTPVDAESGQFTASLSVATPSVNTSAANTMLVTSHTINNADTWTPPAGMTEAFDVSGGTQSIEGNYVLQAASGATGVKTATSTPGPADAGNAHILALRPVCTAVTDATYVSAAAPSGTTSVSLYWASVDTPLILRKTAAFAGEAPTNGQAYAAGNTIGAATVVYDGSAGVAGMTCSAGTCTNTGLTNGTTYYYKVFPRSGNCYAAGTGAEVNATPVASTTGVAWSYTLAGGPMLKAGIAGDTTVHTASNASSMLSINSSDGTQTWSPVATTQPIQSWLTWLPSKGGINAVQSGTATLVGTSLDVAITPVALSRSILFFNVREDIFDSGAASVRGQLTSSANIQFNRAAAAGSVTIKWYVAEFVSGVTVQRGSTLLTTSPINVPIKSVDLGKTFVLSSWQKPGVMMGNDDYLRARLTSATTLELYHDTVGSTLDGTADWQVVTMASATVQSGDLSFITTDASKTVTISSVDTAKSFLIANWSSLGTSVGGNAIRGRITSPTQLTFDRGVTGTALDLTWFVVTLNEGSTVQSGNASFGAATTQVNVSPLTAVSLTRSVAFLSGYQRSGSTPYPGVTPDDDAGVSWFTADLTSTTNLRLTRDATLGFTAEAPWFVVEFGVNPGPASVIGGDQSGRVYDVDVTSGVTNWTADLSATADFIAATPAAQLQFYADAAFLAAYTDDVIFVGSRNAGATNCGTSTTNNKLFALRASDGAVLWTFNGTCTSAMDWIVGMPYVDYTRNRLYVTSRAGGAGTQTSLWVIDTLTGAQVTPPSPLTLGHMDASPTLSTDGSTIYAGSWNGTTGTLYAVNATTLAVKWSLALGASGNIKGFLWEDPGIPGRLYFSNGTDIRCVQDNGASGTACGGWTAPAVAGASSVLLLNNKIYVGSSDGKLHQVNTSTGADEKQFPAASTLDGTQVGDVSTQSSTEVFVGTAAGKLYKIPLPLP